MPGLCRIPESRKEVWKLQLVEMIMKAKQQKKGKATGIDNMPREIFISDAGISANISMSVTTKHGNAP